MSNVRRVNVWINYKLNHGEEIQNDKAYGSHSLMPWEEYERLRAVVDAAREVVEIRSCTNRLRKALRALDGEP